MNIDLEILLLRLGNKSEVCITMDEWNFIMLQSDSSYWGNGLEPATRIALMNEGIVAYLLPIVTSRNMAVPVIIGAESAGTKDQIGKVCSNCETEKKEIIENFAKNLIENQQDLPPECAKVLNDHFWDLIDDYSMPKKDK